LELLVRTRVEVDVKGLSLAAISVAFALALIGCGSAKTELAITVANGEGSHAYRLGCDPPTGNVPRPAEPCDLTAHNREAMLSPPDTHQACGAVLVPFIHLEGRYRGDRVNADVSSCYGSSHIRGERLWLTFLPPPPGWKTTP
jgi:hypothetical protein